MSSEEELKAQVEKLQAELASEKGKAKSSLRLQVSQKGGVSLYGIRRFPVTFYLEEWNRILNMEGEIREFLSEHESELKKKG